MFHVLSPCTELLYKNNNMACISFLEKILFIKEKETLNCNNNEKGDAVFLKITLLGNIYIQVLTPFP